MAYRRRFVRRGRGRFRPTPGLRRVRASGGQNLPTYTRSRASKLLHVFPTAQAMLDLVPSNAVPTIVHPATNANAIVLNQIPRTTGMAARIGTKIRLRELLLNYEASAAVNGAIQHQHVRVVVYYDRRPVVSSSSLPAVTDIFENDDVYAFRNLNSRDRIDVLYDQRFQLTNTPIYNSNSQSSQYERGVSTQKQVSVRIPINRLTSWLVADSAGSYQSMTYGTLVLMVLSPQSPGGTSPDFTFNFKLSFDDLDV